MQERHRRGVSVRRLQEATGFLYSGIHRMERGIGKCDVEAFLSLLHWMGKRPDDYANRPGPSFEQWMREP
jgi:hypothetical protein